MSQWPPRPGRIQGRIVAIGYAFNAALALGMWGYVLWMTVVCVWQHLFPHP